MSTLDGGANGSESNRVDIQLFRAPEILRLTGLSRATINRLMQSGDFPRAVRISNRVVAWKKVDIVAWLESRPEA